MAAARPGGSLTDCPDLDPDMDPDRYMHPTSALKMDHWVILRPEVSSMGAILKKMTIFGKGNALLPVENHDASREIRFYLRKEFRAAEIEFYLHKEFSAAEIRFHLHKVFRAAGIRFYLHKL